MHRCWHSFGSTIIVMATKDNLPTKQSRSATIPTGEESMIPVSQPSSLGELATSMVTEADKRLEAVQRAQISSLSGADKTKKPQEKTPKRLSPTLATRPKNYVLEMWMEVETPVGVYTAPRRILTVSILQLTLLTVPTQVAPACIWAWLVICWPSTARRLTLGPASPMIKPLLLVKPSSIFPLGWDTLLDGG